MLWSWRDPSLTARGDSPFRSQSVRVGATDTTAVDFVMVLAVTMVLPLIWLKVHLVNMAQTLRLSEL
ncbi:hypothetical protein Y032_0248g94 [Ancylostoma ceylanicum]|uniref:Uncharacterized protein n=1 Tax=Ancylostoma ceylanicum TaxID=53326 RepID=A0A016SCL3_9BILA|nr:hypothetical protein Y032_0248g94 [Ancylostoma ceylanicum]